MDIPDMSDEVRLAVEHPEDPAWVLKWDDWATVGEMDKAERELM